jgi:hypothetical protein
MKGPYGLELQDGRETSETKGSSFSWQVRPESVKEFDAIKSMATYPS